MITIQKEAEKLRKEELQEKAVDLVLEGKISKSKAVQIINER